MGGLYCRISAGSAGSSATISGTSNPRRLKNNKMSCGMRFQQFDILTSVDSDESLQPPFKLRHPKWCSVSSLTII